ncbi:MAG: hypothetical protein ACU0B7_00055 [Paracoccaceae bacterium]|uniref:hypothetical protein n=1 Tax=Seohaeicola saemankumensis TaxID=481181 RepID=UPI001E5493DD|nr:hypothetical protein [Seohaeicola saemankumensis]MCD1624456.1 hypothetical protein [Seohaeicola saemankumensis]
MAYSSDLTPVAAPAARPFTVVSPNRSGSRALASAARFTGVVLMLAALGIWILNGPLWDAEMMLMRLAVSVLFMCAGLGLLQFGRARPQDEIHFDASKGQLRHVLRGADGIARVRQRFALCDLGEIAIDVDRMILRDRSGEIVMELSGLPRASLQIIRDALRQHSH